jgi:hypothetical protein
VWAGQRTDENGYDDVRFNATGEVPGSADEIRIRSVVGFGGDPEKCLASEMLPAAWTNIGTANPIGIGDATFAGREPDRVWQTYDLRLDDGSEGVGLFVQCQVLVPDSAVLIIRHLVWDPEHGYDEQHAAVREKVLARLELPEDPVVPVAELPPPYLPTIDEPPVATPTPTT